MCLTDFLFTGTSCPNLPLTDYCILGLRWADDPSLVQRLPSHKMPWWELDREENCVPPRNLGLCIEYSDRMGLTLSQFGRGECEEKRRDVWWPRAELWPRLVVFISIRVLSSLTIHQSCISYLPLHLGMTIWTSAYGKWCVSFFRPMTYLPCTILLSFSTSQLNEANVVSRKGWSSNLLGSSNFYPSVWCKGDRNYNYIKLLKLGGCFYSS